MEYLDGFPRIWQVMDPQKEFIEHCVLTICKAIACSCAATAGAQLINRLVMGPRGLIY